MNSKLLILIIAILSLASGIFYYRSQTLNLKLISQVDKSQTTMVERLKQRGFSFTPEEESLVLELAESGSNEEQILSGITQRRTVFARIKSEKTPEMCNLSRQEILSKAFSEGANLSDLNEVAAIYDLVCFGETNVDISQYGTDEKSAQEEFNDKITEDCKKDQDKYNSCLTKYNTEMIEYQSCMTCKANDEYGCGLACIKPYNNCEQYKPSSLCNF